MYGARIINKEKELHQGVGPLRPMATTLLVNMHAIIYNNVVGSGCLNIGVHWKTIS